MGLKTMVIFGYSYDLQGTFYPHYLFSGIQNQNTASNIFYSQNYILPFVFFFTSSCNIQWIKCVSHLNVKWKVTLFLKKQTNKKNYTATFLTCLKNYFLYKAETY